MTPSRSRNKLMSEVPGQSGHALPGRPQPLRAPTAVIDVSHPNDPSLSERLEPSIAETSKFIASPEPSARPQVAVNHRQHFVCLDAGDRERRVLPPVEREHCHAPVLFPRSRPTARRTGIASHLTEPMHLCWAHFGPIWKLVDVGRTTGPLRPVADRAHVSAFLPNSITWRTGGRTAVRSCSTHTISERTNHGYGYSEILQQSKRLRLHSAGPWRKGCFRPCHRAGTRRHQRPA